MNSNTILQQKDPYVLYALLALVYFSGLFIPLMENDSAQHATMAMRMYLENDFINIYKGTADYLDKPHMHFWLAALSFKVFGISHWAYRIPAIIFTIIGAFSTCKLAKEFYGNKASHVASLIFLSSQAIILSNHDVRTDAVLTGAVIFCVWQLVLFINYNRLANIILGAIGAGVAFSTKGLLGVFISGICILTYLVHSRKWKSIWSWKSVIGLLTLAITICPVLYSYYVQFDLHPEKVFNGKNNVSGVRFILWDQSFNRLTAKGFKKTSPNYLFFFHTLLWAFLPWSLMAYTALFDRLKKLIKEKFIFKPSLESMTSIGFLIIMLIISTSKFKLPHYLNSLLPILSVLVTGYIIQLTKKKKGKALTNWLYIQMSTLIIGFLFVVFICLWSFPMPHIALIIGSLFLIYGLYYWLSKPKNTTRKLIVFSVCITVLCNLWLNIQFYPKLIMYQSGSTAAKVIQNENINVNDVFMINGIKNSWSLDFYNKRQTPLINITDIPHKLKTNQWLFVEENQLKKLTEENINWRKKIEIQNYRITRLSKRFLNPNTRHEVLNKTYLLQLINE